MAWWQWHLLRHIQQSINSYFGNKFFFIYKLTWPKFLHLKRIRFSFIFALRFFVLLHCYCFIFSCFLIHIIIWKHELRGTLWADVTNIFFYYYTPYYVIALTTQLIQANLTTVEKKSCRFNRRCRRRWRWRWWHWLEFQYILDKEQIFLSMLLFLFYFIFFFVADWMVCHILAY